MNKKARTLALEQTFFADNPVLSVIAADILRAAELMCSTCRKGGQILVCGNGGSAADGDHIVGELMKGFLLRRPLSREDQLAFSSQFGEEGERIASMLQRGLPAISLNAHAALNSAFANDVDPVLSYAQQVLGYGRPGDLLIGISTSGMADNVCAAMITARARGLQTLALTGKDGGRLSKLAECAVIAPAEETYRIQELHLAMYHYLCAYTESEIFDA